DPTSSPVSSLDTMLHTPSLSLALPTNSSSPAAISSIPDPPLRRSTRTTFGKVPSHLKDYICNSIVPTDVTHSCFFSTTTPPSFSVHTLSTPNQATLQSCSHIFEPSSYAQACSYPGWKNVMDAELEALQSNKTWDVVSLPQGRKDLPCKWVYKVKQHVDGSLER
ncbi:hypothetical protein KY285_000550, partial [Solanum tuberosum]